MKINRPIPAAEIRLVIFDLDGTLVDSRVDLANSVNAMLREFRRPELPIEVVASYVGDGAPMLVRRALGDPQDQVFLGRALEFFLSYYREHKLDNTHAYDGIPEALRRIRNAHGRPRTLAVLSNKPVNPSRAIVEELGMGELFAKVYGGNSFETKKPDPRGVQALLRETSTSPAHAVLVGDSDVDVLTASHAGIHSIGVRYGFAPHTLDRLPPDVLVETPAELAQVFGK